ncbi:hypothetical protein [Pseudoalteromonas rubra]|uniref:hypothetical protein n=1 Tax=Pseudoalteromonas rubra TaxID=43658 RepID=UPI0019809CD4|nr:hypothetical protein [Pseudoalteromonas rubra]
MSPLFPISNGRIKAPEVKLLDFSVDTVRDALNCLLGKTCQQRPVIRITHD